MFRGRCKLDTLVISDVTIRLTARGLEIRGQGVLRARSLKRPQADVSFVQTDWDHGVVDKAIELLGLMEQSSSSRLMDSPQDLEAPQEADQRTEGGERNGADERTSEREDDLLSSLEGESGFPGEKDTQF